MKTLRRPTIQPAPLITGIALGAAVVIGGILLAAPKPVPALHAGEKQPQTFTPEMLRALGY